MGDYPDPDEEYELMYGDDLEALREHEELCPELENNTKSRRSLDFSSPAIRKTFGAFNEVVSLDAGASVQGDRSPCRQPRGPEANSLSRDSHILKETPLNQSDVRKLRDSTTTICQKRNLEDLFGEIDDLEEDEGAKRESKRHRGEGEACEERRDRLLTERIVELRRVRRSEGLGALLSSGPLPSSCPAADNLSFSVPRWPFLPLTRSDGEKVYIRIHNEDFMEREIDDLTKCSGGITNLLGNSFKSVWEEATLYLENKLPLKPTSALEENVISEEGDLWVERYRPRSYCDLLSDEATNRTLLRWLKMWDMVVFNREVKIKKSEMKSTFNKRSGKFEFGRSGRDAGEGEGEPTLDAHGRPSRTVALLCGPPGCGKTTLAHLLARHAGYKVVEVNASDDRNVDAFKSALENATQMKSVLDSEKRPNCLVLDEIDGAPSPAIEYLVKFVSGAPSGKGKKGQKSKVHIVRRPIICICNDLYAPSLRPLRQVALVLAVPPAGLPRLAERLAEVAEREGLLAPDAPLLAALARRTDGDIRACITVLHFCKTKGKTLKLADIDKLNIGLKDVTKSLFRVWKEVFQIEASAESDGTGVKGRAGKLLRTVCSAGDYERLAQGVFENYLERGGGLGAVCQALDWFAAGDRFSSHIGRTQNYSMYPYLSYSFLCWHFLFARLSRVTVKYPKRGFEMYQRQTLLSGVTSGIRRGVCARVKPYCSGRSLLLDLLPLLPHIVSPALRPVDVQLYTERERRCLSSLVGVMLDYNLRYVQRRQPDGDCRYVLDPDISAVGIFDEKTAVVRNLTYAVKQTIARQVDLEEMSRAEGGGALASEAAPAPALAPAAASPEPRKVRSVIPSVMKDFFGRSIACSPATAARKVGKTDDIVRSPVWYHYKEGFNNAVRRDVKIGDLL